MDHLTDDDIATIALEATDSADASGSLPDAWEHLAGCARCTGELASYRRVLELGHEVEADRGPATSPPAEAWNRISSELGLSASLASPSGRLAAGDVRPLVPARRQGVSGRVKLLAAAAVLAIAAVGGGVIIGRATMSRPPAAATITSAHLTPVTAGTSAAAGNATVTNNAQGSQLTVITDHLPLREGFYQVWLYDQQANKMVPIGTLDAAGDGTFTVAPSIDIRNFNIVDVSAQELNGDPAHGTSILQGTLTQ